MRKDKGDEEMAMPEMLLKEKPLKTPKRLRTNLLKNATTEDIKVLNDLSKKERGLSNLTYRRVFGEE